MAYADDSNPFVIKREHPNSTQDFAPVGSTFRQESYADLTAGDLVMFIAEPDNKYDPHAIGVYVIRPGVSELIGYIPKTYNQTITPEEWGGYIISVRDYEMNGKQLRKADIRIIDLTVPAD